VSAFLSSPPDYGARQLDTRCYEEQYSSKGEGAYWKTLSVPELIEPCRPTARPAMSVLPHVPEEEHDSKFISLSDNIFLNSECNSTFFLRNFI
jgi:hypothetical protein